VDDEPNVLQALKRALHSQEQVWNMIFLTSARDALIRLAEYEVDTIVTDIPMPEIDGFELIHQVREIQGRLDIPIIVLTGLAETDLKRRALEIGATDLLSKPVDREDLIARVKARCRSNLSKTS